MSSLMGVVFCIQVLPKAAADPAVGKKDAKGAAKRKDAPGGAASKAVAKKGKSGVGGGKT